MEVQGMYEVPIKLLKLPGDFAQRLKAPHVQELADSMESVGQLHEPVVRASDKKLIAGCDRVAAHRVRGLETVLVKLVDCDDDEAEAIMLEENVRRRCSTEERDRQLERLLALYSARGAREIERERKETGGRPDPGELALDKAGRRPVSKRVVRAKVAKLKGIKPESVRKAEQRARERRLLNEQPPAPESPPSPIHDLGFTLQADWLAQVAEVKTLIDRAAQGLQNVQGLLSIVANKQLPFPPARLQRMREDAHALAAALRANVPSHLCPWCKGQEAYQAKCTACASVGYIVTGQLQHVPGELWGEDVVWDWALGRAVSMRGPEEDDTPGDLADW